MDKDGHECAALLYGWDNLRGDLAVAPQRERVIHPADGFGSSFHLIAMEHVDRNKHIFESCERAGPREFFSQNCFIRGRAHLHQAVEFINDCLLHYPTGALGSWRSRRGAHPDR